MTHVTKILPAVLDFEGERSGQRAEEYRLPLEARKDSETDSSLNPPERNVAFLVL